MAVNSINNISIISVDENGNEAPDIARTLDDTTQPSPTEQTVTQEMLIYGPLLHKEVWGLSSTFGRNGSDRMRKKVGR